METRYYKTSELRNIHQCVTDSFPLNKSINYSDILIMVLIDYTGGEE